MSWQLGLQYAARTDVGMRRKNNQDSHVVVLASDERTWRDVGHIFVVADGMGAHAAGELASKLAVDNIPHLYQKHRDISPPEALEKAVTEANAEIHRRGKANIDFHAMGTTACTLVLLPQGALLAHVGDSRVYRQRGEQFEQLTFDHSLVWELRASGQLPQNDELAKLVPKNVITRSLGPNENVQVDIEGPLPVELGDSFLMCSDGLSGLVADEEIGPILAYLPPDEASQVLIDLANLRGGPDNITVVIAKVVGPELVSRGDEPIRLGPRTTTRPVHPAVWVVSGVCVLAAAVMAISQNWIPAFVALAGAVVTLGAGWAARFGGGSGGATLGPGNRLGKGPYTRTSCSHLDDFLPKLSKIVNDLGEAAEENHWQVDIATFRHLVRQGEEATRSQKPSVALKSYARAISQMMKELRTKKPRAASSDSAIDL